MTQHEQIMKYIEEHGSVSPFEAFIQLGITKLATRVGEIERAGLASYEHRMTENSNGKRFMVYYKKEAEKDDAQLRR